MTGRFSVAPGATTMIGWVGHLCNVYYENAVLAGILFKLGRKRSGMNVRLPKNECISNHYRTTSGKSSREGPEWESERAEWVTRDREPTGPTRPGRLGTVREERIVGVNE